MIAGQAYEEAHKIKLLAQNTLEKALSLCEENWEMKKRLKKKLDLKVIFKEK